MEPTPSTNGDNGGPLADGRQADGRFVKGNPGGPGNPHAAAVGTWRKALSQAVSEDDLRAVVLRLVEKAKAGEPWAVREVLDRCLGKPRQGIDLEANIGSWDAMVAALEAAEAGREA